MATLIKETHTQRVADLYWDLYGEEGAHRASAIATRMDGVGDIAGAEVWRSVSHQLTSRRTRGIQ